MSRLRKAIPGLLAIWIAGSAAAAPPSVEDFFRPAPDTAARFDPAKVYPHGRLFPFGFYGLKTSRDKPEGLTLLGPYGTDENIAIARQLGIQCTYTVGLPMEFHTPSPQQLSPDEIRQRIREQVAKAAGSREIAWWYLRPEELRYWRKNELAYLEAASEAVHAADPLKRPLWMYEPNHRDAAALARTLKFQDICGKGLYTNYSGKQDSRVWVRWSIEQEVEAIRQTGGTAIPIAVPEMFQDPPEELRPMIPRWVRHDIYVSLITGAEGIMVFSGWRRPRFETFDAYFAAYAGCARELNGPLGLGQVFLFGQRREDIRVRVLGGPERLVLAGKSDAPADRLGEYPPVSALDVAHGPHRYLFLASSANEAVQIAVEGLPAAPLGLEDLFEKEKVLAVDRGRLELTLEPLAVRAYRLSPARRADGS
ncbi:MAG: hypothetical protein HUU20_16185 [Pirellulales bacterium]|nr:hypothetical protein [Pirellulales bacterium]